MKRNLLLLISLLTLFGCKSSKPIQQLPQQQESRLMDVAYGKHERQIMDVFLPAKRNKNTPFVLLIHGGAWTMAGKEYIRDYQDTLFQHGIAVVSINHRYADHAAIHYQQMLADIDQALDYCIAHSSEWNTRKDGFTMTGVSSGAHLALLYGYTSSKRIKTIVEFCGPVNLTDTTTLAYSEKVGLKDVIVKMTGHTYESGQPLDISFYKSSPIKHIKDIPVLIVHGTADPVVDFSQSQQLSDSLSNRKIVHELVRIEGAGHDLNMTDKNARKRVYGAAIQWIKQYGH